MIWVLCTIQAIRGMVDPAADLHGYGRIAAIIFGLFAGALATVILPLAFAEPHRSFTRRAAGIALLVSLGVYGAVLITG
ncbi:hypothetical protein HGQ17_14110 [Nesterenkonia sp. MY13]|uniref:Uncharacterized protein n=1 Tax=Nesterenkonia sedimenti TaxID=1463632 RepID=A0A7X8YF33_9MICC|nr:hypothetical protein [Nesterenkonia sedimenti]NLS11110.1 hypothetical protein [Nesterenkonia sedimenti]